MTQTRNAPEPEKIRHMFSQVATNYDKANSILSLGIHHLWRKKLVELSGAREGQRVLDCATGTGDLAIEFKKAVGMKGEVIGTDFCIEMLATAPKKAALKNREIRFEVADVTALPYPNDKFDIASISFGIRNVQDPIKALQEMARVVKPGGNVLVLEFGQVDVPALGKIYSIYSEKVLPWLGGWITGQKKAYEYLQKSSASFPCKENFIEMMRQTGSFDQMDFTAVSAGIAYIYKGRVK